MQTPVASVEAKGRQIYMVMENALPNCNDSSAFSSREVVSLIKVITWNKEPLM
jgi:hypothetical protein